MDYNEFKEQVHQLLNIDLEAYKEGQMKRRIEAMLLKKKSSYEEYIKRLQTDRHEVEYFKSYLTINVSEFFRNKEQWDILEQEILPDLINKKKELKVWSAACSTGDEPYSLAILLMKMLPIDRINILATDIDQEILKKAKEGCYPYRQIQSVPVALQKKLFIQKDDKFFVDDVIKKSVIFKQHDLIKESYPKDIDLLVCRNVLIYLTEDIKKDIYTKFSKALAKGGILFVGGTEQIINPARYGLKSLYPFFYIKTND